MQFKIYDQRRTLWWREYVSEADTCEFAFQEYKYKDPKTPVFNKEAIGAKWACVKMACKQIKEILDSGAIHKL